MNTAFTASDRVLVYGNQRAAIQAMLDYDYVCGKEKPSLVGIVNPSARGMRSSEIYFFGGAEVRVPVFQRLEAVEIQPTVLVNFASSRSAYGVASEALRMPSLEKIVIIAEGMPEREARLLRAAAREAGKAVVGPATVGGLSAGAIKIGNAGGTLENVIANRLHLRGSVGVVSKSGGLLNEFMTIVARTTDGVAEALALGGDRFPLTTLAEQVERYQKNKDIKLIVIQGEVGGTQEYDVAELLRQGKVTKPVVAWVSGTGATALSENIQFGHAGAMANGEAETAAAKNAALKKAGALVPASYAEFEGLIRKTAKKLGLVPPAVAPAARPLPQDLPELLRRGTVRHAKGIVTSIGPGGTYHGKSIAETAEKESIGHILGLLWFGREVPAKVARLFELILKLTADHGAAVSGAHNTIVAARAGKDLVSSLASGLLTIGPRFGGAVNDAATCFRSAVREGQSAFDFVAMMKAKERPIPGIGHRVKSRTNPDERVALLKEAAGKPGPHLSFALAVEAVTTRKKDTLILNVDGAIAAILLDVLTQELGEDEVGRLVEMEAFNAFFVLGRSIGLIGHFIDQRRLDQPLYRHPEWDILNVTDGPEGA